MSEPTARLGLTGIPEGDPRREEIEEFVFRCFRAMERIKWWEKDYLMLHGDPTAKEEAPLLASINLAALTEVKDSASELLT